MSLNDSLARIDALQQEIESFRPLPPEREQRIMQKFRLDWNYHSNNIEGNSLTYGETKALLLFGLTAEGKPLKDAIEIKGHNEALLALEDIIHKDSLLTESDIRNLHSIILGGEPFQKKSLSQDGLEMMRWIYPGKYKTQPNHVKTVTGEMFYFALPEETPAKMQELLTWLREQLEAAKVHALPLAALFHYKFVRIHPFDDGNGRMARILMNLMLMMKGYPPVIIKTYDKENYLRALNQADSGNEEAFVEYIAQQLLHAQELWLRGAKGENIEESADWEKKVDLFLAELGTEEENILKIARSKKAMQDVLDKAIYPLCEQLEKRLDKIGKLFLKTEYRYGFSNMFDTEPNALSFIYRSPSKPIQEVDNKIKTSINTNDYQIMYFLFIWRGFRYSTINPFSISTDFSIFFSEYNYIIKRGKQHLFSIPYHQNLSEEEIATITAILGEDALKQIKEKTSSPPESAEGIKGRSDD